MKNVSLNQHIGIEDLASLSFADQNAVKLSITKNMTFDPGAEGIAIGLIQQAVRHGVKLHVELSYSPTDDAGRPQGVLESLFGTQLLFAAATVTTQRGGATNIRPELLQIVWGFVTSGNGEIGDGKKKTIIFRDPDYSIPPCIHQSNAPGFPLPERFKQVIKRMSRQLAGEAEISSLPAEDEISSFLYEAALNTHEHGREFSPDTRGTRLSIRGIILEKLRFNSLDDLNRRKSISADMREYLARIMTTGPSHRSFFSATVADVGAGIHATIAALHGEDNWSRLLRAFKSGVTRKPITPNKRMGEGLPNIMQAASALDAYIVVCSGSLIGTQDFSIQTDDNIPKVLQRSAYSMPKDFGTSLTIIWPSKFGRGSQGELFEK